MEAEEFRDTWELENRLDARNYPEDFAEDYHKARVEAISDVSQQRELLKAFVEFINRKDTTNHTYPHLINHFLDGHLYLIKQ